MDTITSHSVSRIPVDIIVENKVSLKAEFIRHLSPLTISQIIKNIPLSGGVHYNQDKFCYIQTNLTIGAEKQKKKFQIGDIGYLTTNASICFFINDVSDTFPMNHLGKMICSIDKIRNLKPTDAITIKIATKEN